ncbi:MAG TPA: DUF1800 domain-containing protein [Phycisphaerae bacterium]|nr:DUF1800 domain-containing protein [Phycisphaerae bacterium]
MDNPLQPIWQSDAGRWDFSMAAHLLRRAGFGGALGETQALVEMGPEKAVSQIVRYGNIANPGLGPLVFGDLTNPIDQGGAGGRRGGGRGGLLRSMSAEQRKGFQQIEQTAQRAKLEELKLWWLDRMVRTTRPLEEKMTLFWHGLFVSSSATVKNTYLLYQQNELFRKHAAGNYKQLTLEVSKNPAMLIYLNNNDNRVQHPNENYARELMELFTLGIGNYTETDIKESARSFTGWTNIGDQFVFNRGQHDEGVKHFLGRAGNFTGEDIVNIIFQQPACAKYIAGRLVRFFGLDEPPAEIVEPLAEIVAGNHYEMAPALLALFGSKWFYSQDVVQRQIKSPVQLVVGSLRSLGVPVSQPRAVDNALKLMGQELFNAPTVKGWDGGRAWINTSTLFARYNLPAYLGTGKLPTAGKGAQGASMDMRTTYAEFDSGWRPDVDLAEGGVSTTDGVVDLYIKKLLGADLDARKREELLIFMNGTGDTKSHMNDPLLPDNDRRTRSLVHLIMAMAEYQLA